MQAIASMSALADALDGSFMARGVARLVLSRNG